MAALLAESDCMAIRILSACGVSVAELKKELGNFLDTIPGKNALKEQQRGRDSLRHSVPGAPTTSNYGRNLTQLARLGMLDPIIGRERETLRVIQILSRRTKNNPCLIGEPGGQNRSGRGLAQKIADSRVPENLEIR